MTTRKWHSGPPPHIGWWSSSSALRLSGLWRWWDGKRWSIAVAWYDDAKYAADSAGCPSTAEYIEWTDYYPKNARVPRINPEKT